MKNIQPRLVILLLIVCLHTLSTPLWACSVTEGYLRPSNYDLVKKTEAILLAEAASVDRAEMKVTFKVLEVIKGDFAEKTLVDEGMDVYLGKGNENDFVEARPGAGAGACTAYDYQIGKKFLLFVNKTEGKWSISGPPFSRVNEEVSSGDSPWVVAVRQYTRISSVNNYESEKVELRRLQENARGGKEAEAYPEGLVEDIDTYLESAYPTKSYQDLMALYGRASKQGRRKVLWAFALGKHPEAELFAKKLMQSGEWEEYIAPISEIVQHTKDKSLLRILAATYLKGTNESWFILDALINMAGEEDAGVMLAVLKAADEGETKWLAPWFVRHPNKEATEIIRKRVDARYEERWELAFSLAGLGDDAVLELAKEILGSSGKNSWMGYYILAHSPLAEADRWAKAVIQGGEPKALTMLVQGYKDSLNPNRWDRLSDVIHLKSKDPEVNEWLRTTLKSMASRGEDRASQLLEGLNGKTWLH